MDRLRAGMRSVHGIVVLDKPPGQTSNRALQRVKRLYGATKAGHTGSLDPFATGMLPVCLGAATKVSAYLLDAGKEYDVEVELGQSTDTGDPDGKIIAESSVPPLDENRLQAALETFVGPGLQTPPMYSALKRDGRRLYELARQGIEVDRPARPIHIDWIRFASLDAPRFRFSVRCSKGTYIRSLAMDIAAELGTLGYVTALRRLAVDPFRPESMVTLDALEAAADGGEDMLDRMLLAPDSVLVTLPRIEVGAADRQALVQGRAVPVVAIDGGLVRIYGPDGCFVGLGERGVDGALQPRRIFVT